MGRVSWQVLVKQTGVQRGDGKITVKRMARDDSELAGLAKIAATAGQLSRALVTTSWFDSI
jgi:hypothetical protein